MLDLKAGHGAKSLHDSDKSTSSDRPGYHEQAQGFHAGAKKVPKKCQKGALQMRRLKLWLQ
jgi:hypothetical protein